MLAPTGWLASFRWGPVLALSRSGPARCGSRTWTIRRCRVIDPAGLQTLRTLPVGGTPTGIAASADAIWVAETAPGATGAVSVVRIVPDFNTIGPPQRISQVVTGSPGEIAAQGDAVVGGTVFGPADPP